MDANEQKQQAAEAALELLPEAGVLGLGTGSTAKLFIDGVGRLVKQGRKFLGVATSDASHRQAQELGIPLLDPDGPWEIDVCVDGADEVNDALDLIKGGGGAHLREKIVNFAAKRNVIIVDESKLSRRLGERWPVPLEILGFAHRAIAKSLEALGEPVLRLRDGVPWRTDSGNYIYDLRVGPISDPGELEQRLALVPGVVESGLFVGRADTLLIASAQGVRRVDRNAL